MNKMALTIAIGLCILCYIVGQRELLAQGGVPCGLEQKHKIVRHRGEHPIPAPSGDKAIVFVMLPWHLGGNGHYKIAVDHLRWVAAIEWGQYTYFEMEPGAVTLSSYVPDGTNLGSSRLMNDLVYEFKANQIYFIQTSMVHIPQISEVSQAEVADRLRKFEYVTFAPKGDMTNAEIEHHNSKFLEEWKQIRPGMTPQDLYTSLGLGELGLTAQFMAEHRDAIARTHGLAREDLWSIEIRGGEARVYSCGYEFIFRRGALESWQGLRSQPCSEYRDCRWYGVR
jgi:hypothetical protein